MSPDGQPSAAPAERQPAIVVVNFPMSAGGGFDWHEHVDHQLAWAPTGVLTVVTGNATFVLPPTRALWIPVGLRHQTLSVGKATMRSLYIQPERCQIRWTEPTPVVVPSLLAGLISYLDDTSITQERREHAEALLVDLLEPVPTATIDLRLPADERAREVAEALLLAPADQQTISEWGRHVGASGRTLARLFLAETGMPFGRWRTLLRLRAALPELARGAPVGTVARHVGYETASAFVAAFRRETGLTPGSYFTSREN